MRRKQLDRKGKQPGWGRATPVNDSVNDFCSLALSEGKVQGQQPISSHAVLLPSSLCCQGPQLP